MAVIDPRVDPAAARLALARLARATEAPWLHEEAARRMGERLDWIKRQPGTVIDWSDAAGGSAAVLTAAYPRAQHWHLRMDAAGVAARQAPTPWWRRLSGAPVVRSVTADAVEPGTTELVWSNMRLHFEPDPLPMLQAWHRALAPDGFLMFSTLGPGSFGSLRAIYARAGWGPPHAPFVDMHDLGDMLVTTGFAEPVMDQETLTLSYASPETLLGELRHLGANLAPGRFAGLRTAQWRRRLEEQLLENATETDGRLLLQVELVYGHAFRAADAGPRVDAETQIGLDAMKLMLRQPRRAK
ncbi:MAG TPA: biotin synthase [Ideonella sp.]|nr:biotin synthase [Ideonella sp.]